MLLAVTLVEYEISTQRRDKARRTSGQQEAHVLQIVKSSIDKDHTCS
jgi:hypothetical protein